MNVLSAKLFLSIWKKMKSWESAHKETPPWGVYMPSWGSFFVLIQSLSLGALAVVSPALAEVWFSCSFMSAFANFKSKKLTSHKSLASAAAASASAA